MTGRRWLVFGLAGAALLLLAGRVLATLYVDYRWFEAMGASQVWRMQTENALFGRGLSLVFGSTFLFLNLYAVRNSVVSLVLPRRVANLEIGEEVPGHYLTVVVLALSVALGAILTVPQESWTAIALERYGIPFGAYTPYFPQLDIGFFVYWLPLETSLYLWSLIALLLAVAVVVFLYALTPSLRWERGSLHVSGYVRRHFAVLGALLLAVLAWSYRLDAYELVISGSGKEAMFSYVDKNAGVTVNLVLSVITLSAALVVLFSGWAGQVKVAFVTVTVILVLALGLRGLVPAVAQRMSPDDPGTRERPFEATRASYTQNAFAAHLPTVAPESIQFASLRDAARAVPVWDAAALASAVERGGASILGGTIAWRGSPAGIVSDVAARPARDGARAGADAQWGIARALAGAADNRGGLVRVDRAGAQSTEDILVAPTVVAEPGAGTAIVADSLNRLVAPVLGSTLSRLAYAWSRQDWRPLLGDLPGRRPKLLMRRGVRERVGALAPFFVQGTSVTPVLAADTLYWMVELYSASTSYPLSEHVRVAGGEYNYFRRAATAFVNGASGSVMLVRDSVVDSLAATWISRLPGMFRSWSSVPDAIAEALPPDADEAFVQARVLARYGRRDEAWPMRHLPLADGADSVISAGGAGAYFHVLSPAGGPRLLFPVLDAGERVQGFVVADGGRRRRTAWAPLAAPGPRWSVAVDRFQRAADSAGAARGAALQRGRMRAIPVAGTIAFLQSQYAWRPAEGAALVRVSVLEGDVLRHDRTLADLVGFAPPPSPLPSTPQEFRTRVGALYEAMRSALRRGDWPAFGAAYDELGRLLAAPR